MFVGDLIGDACPPSIHATDGGSNGRMCGSGGRNWPIPDCMLVFNPCKRVGMFMLWGLSKDKTMDEVGAEVDGGRVTALLRAAFLSSLRAWSRRPGEEASTA